MRFTDDSLDNLEYNRLLELVPAWPPSRAGGGTSPRSSPVESLAELQRIHALVGELRQGQERGEDFNFGSLADTRPAMNLLDVEGVVC